MHGQLRAEDDKYSPTGATSSSISAPVGWGLNLALCLTAVTEVTVELTCGRGMKELSLTNAVKSDDLGLKGLEHPQHLCHDCTRNGLYLCS